MSSPSQTPATGKAPVLKLRHSQLGSSPQAEKKQAGPAKKPRPEWGSTKPAGTTQAGPAKKPQLAPPRPTGKKPIPPVDDNDELVADLRQQVADLKLQLDIANIGKDDDAHEKEREESRSKLQKSEAEVKRLREDNLKQSERISSLGKENSGLRREVKDKDEKITELQAQVVRVSTLEADYNVLVEGNAELKDTISKLEKDIQGKNNRISGMANQILEKEHEVKLVQNKANEVEDLQAEIPSLKQENLEMIEVLKGKVASLEQRNHELQEQIDATCRSTSSPDSGSDEPTKVATQTVAEMQARASDLELENEQLKEQLRLVEAQVVVCEAKDELLETLEEQNSELLDQVANAVGELRSKKALAQHFQTRAHQLQKQINDLETWNSCAENQPNVVLDQGAQTPPEPKRADSAVTERTFETEPPVNIIINIDPSDQRNWTMLQKMRAAVTKATTIEFYGPPELIHELNQKMEEIAFDYDLKTKKVTEQHKLLIGQQKEIARLEKRPECMVARHKALLDEIAAKDAQIELNVSILQSQGQQLERWAEEKKVGVADVGN